MHSQELLEYCIIEWVPAAVETIVSLRLFPNLWRDTASNIKILNKTPEKSVNVGKHSMTSRREGWQEDASYQFSSRFIPRSVQLFKVNIPQVEGLRSSLLSEARFGTHIPWRIRIDVYLHTFSATGVWPTKERRYSPHNGSGSVSDWNTKNVSSTAEMDDAFRGKDSYATYKLRSHLLYKAQNPSPKDGSTGCDIPSAQTSKEPHRAIRDVKLLERWMISFDPCGSSDCQERFGHRKLCTALKGLLAAAHMLPTHSALCTLKDKRDAPLMKGRSYGQYTHSTEVRIAGQWFNVQSGSSNRKVVSVWSPIITYTADIEDPMSLRVNDCSSENAGTTFESNHRGNSGKCNCVNSYEYPRNHSCRQPDSAQCSPFAGGFGTAGNQREHEGFESTSPGQMPHPVYYPGELATGMHKSCKFKGFSDYYPGPQTDVSTPKSVPFNTNCKMEAESFPIQTPCDQMELRNLFSVTTRCGSIVCTVQYDDNFAEKLLALRELEIIESCLSDFHTVSASSSQTEREGEVVRSALLSCDHQTAHKGEFVLECSNDASLGAITSPCQDGLPLYQRTSSGGCCPRGCPLAQNARGSGRWHSLLQDAAFKQARRLASLSADAMGIRQVFESYPSKVVRLICSIVDGGTSEKQRASGNDSELCCASRRSWILSRSGRNYNSHQLSEGNEDFSSIPLCTSGTALAVDVTALFEFEDEDDWSVDECSFIGTATSELCLDLNKASEHFDRRFLSAEERSSLHSRSCVSENCNFGVAAAEEGCSNSRYLFNETKASTLVLSMIDGHSASAFKSLWYLSKNIENISRIVDLLGCSSSRRKNCSTPYKKDNKNLVLKHRSGCQPNRKMIGKMNRFDSIYGESVEWDVIALQAAVIGAQHQEKRAFDKLKAFNLNWNVMSSHGQSKWTHGILAGCLSERKNETIHQEACDIGMRFKICCCRFHAFVELEGEPKRIVTFYGDVSPLSFASG